MKLSISNLAFPSDVDAAKCAALRAAGVSGLEVAPTKIGPWSELSQDRLAEFRSLVEGEGLEISSLQAILFNVPEAQLLQGTAEFESMLSHVQRVSGVASALGASVMVFGAPKQRAKGMLSSQDAFQLGVERFGRLAEICGAEDVIIGLEPVPDAYGGDFLPTWQEVKAMVEAVASRHLAVHLDTACVALGGGDIAEAITSCSGLLRHFHLAEPGLTSFHTPSDGHRKAADRLHRCSYDRWLAIEILGKTESAWQDALDAVMFAKTCYGTNSV